MDFKEFEKFITYMEKVDPKLMKIYEWTQELTAEDKGIIRKYYPTKAARDLAFLLTHKPNGNLIGMKGLQGTGKTTLLLALAQYLNSKNIKAKYIKWTRDWFKVEMDAIRTQKSYRRALNNRLSDIFYSYGTIHKKHSGLGKIPDRVDVKDTKRGKFDMEDIEIMLGTRETKRIQTYVTLENLATYDVLLIDMPDYSKTDKRMMNGDIHEIQTLWHKMRFELENYKTSFLVAIQKELFTGHFWFGKLLPITLEPLTAEDLVKAYKIYHKTPYPFNEDALFLLAKLARGVFRRFLRYIGLCFERTSFRAPITMEDVNNAVSLEQQLEDMKLEFANIFKTEDQKLRAIQILRFLIDKKELNQKQIAEALDLGDMAVSRIMSSLNVRGYIRRVRGKHGEWIISPL